MAKKSALSKALDKRKKKSAKKSTKQVAPQSEHYSSARDKKEKAKPAGYRFKGLDNFKTPTKKEIAADAGKPKKKRKTYFENRKDKSDKQPAAKLENGGLAERKNKKDSINAAFKFIRENIDTGNEKDINDSIFFGIGKKVYGFSNELYNAKIEFERNPNNGLFGYIKNMHDVKRFLSYLYDKNDDSLAYLSGEGDIIMFALGGPTGINAHSGDSPITIQNEMFEKGGRTKKWIQDAINQEHKGALKKKAIRMGLIKNMDEKLSEKDLKELIKKGGVTAKQARLAQRLRKFEAGGNVVIEPTPEPAKPVLPEDATQADVMENGGETHSAEPAVEPVIIEEKPEIEIEPEIKIEPEVEIKVETPQKATIPNFESAAYVENLIEFMGANLEGKLLPNGDYVVLSFLFYPIWFYCAANKSWYGNTDKFNSVTAMHISQSRPTPNAEMLSLMQLFDRMNQGIQTYDLGGVLVRQLYPMTVDNTTVAHQ